MQVPPFDPAFCGEEAPPAGGTTQAVTDGAAAGGDDAAATATDSAAPADSSAADSDTVAPAAPSAAAAQLWMGVSALLALAALLT